MARVGRRLVPQSTIDRRVQAKDDRINAAIAAFRNRTGGAPVPPAPVVPVVVEVAIVADPDARGPVVDVALEPVVKQSGQIEEMLISEDPRHQAFPKPSRLTRAIAQSEARGLDRRQLVAWAFAVKTRDQWRDRRTGIRLLRTLNLDPLRAEAHHVVSKDDWAVRYDVRNGICLSLATHEAVERGLLKIEGTAWFTVGGVTYIDATAPVRFVRG